MAILPWDIRRNLENSLADFLDAQLIAQDIEVLDETGNLVTPGIRIGFKRDDLWKLPLITFYMDSKTAPRLSIGSNKRENEYLLIIEIRACDIGTQLDLSEWVITTINNGFQFFTYTQNPGDPLNPTATNTAFVSFNIISDTSVRLGDNVDQFDQYRQRITIACTITPTI